MVNLKAFDVDLFRPSSVLHYNLDEAFFALFENSLIEKGELTATVKVERGIQNIYILFDIVGTLALTCDRSLEKFNYPICIERKINLKLAQENKELDVDLYTIEQQATSTNIAQHLYDFISLAVPMKKLHPRFLTEEEDLLIT